MQIAAPNTNKAGAELVSEKRRVPKSRKIYKLMVLLGSERSDNEKNAVFVHPRPRQRPDKNVV